MTNELDPTVFDFEEEPLRSRVLNLAAAVRDATDPAVFANRTDDTLRVAFEDGGIVLRYGGVRLLTMEGDTLRSLRDDEDVQVRAMPLPAVPDDVSSLVDGQ